MSSDRRAYSSTSDAFLERAIALSPLLTVSAQTRLPDLLAKLTAHQASCILAVHRHRVVGIATRSDLMRAMAQYSEWSQMRLGQIVSRPVITASPTELGEPALLLERCDRHQLSHLPIVDSQGRPMGLVDRLGLLQTLHEQAVETSLHHRHQRAQLFAEITLKIRQSLQLKEILQTTVDEVQRLLNADRVLIYQVLPDGTGKTISEAVVAPYPAILGIPFPEEVFPQDYQQRYAQGRVQAIADVRAPQSGISECLVEFIEQWGIRSKLIVPIVHPLESALGEESGNAKTVSKLWGLLIAHQCCSPRQWTEFELELMQQLAGQISIALSHGQLLEYLEDRVKLRTVELTQANRSLQAEIQERQQVGNALRQSEEQLRLITNNLPVLIAYVDSQQCYRFNNQAYDHWLGQSPAKIYGQSMKAVMGAADYQSIQSYIETALAGNQVTYESELAFKDGYAHSVSVTYIPHIEAFEQDGSQIKGFFALTTDISDRKAIERMKDEFIAVVSHELRTPLTSIHTSLKLMATGRLGQLSEDGQQMLEVADENTDRLVRLVNNVLDLQRIESGEVTMEAQACDVADLVEKAAEAMQAIAQQHSVDIQTQTTPMSIWADPDYIMQALTNLMGNAIKFSSPGKTIRVSVELALHTSRRPQQKTALFCVQDQGQGIPSDKLNSIFERFQQVDSSDSRKKGGTGLGLAICRKIVEQHGGNIWAESQLGNGSRFYFTVPLSVVPRLAS